MRSAVPYSGDKHPLVSESLKVLWANQSVISPLVRQAALAKRRGDLHEYRRLVRYVAEIQEDCPHKLVRWTPAARLFCSRCNKPTDRA